MRSNLLKFFAIVLASALLAVAAFSGIALIFLIDQDLYEQTPEQANLNFLEAMSYGVAYNYALEHMAMAGGMTDEEVSMLLETMYVPYYIADKVLDVQIHAVDPVYREGVYTFTHNVDGLLYPVAVEDDEQIPEDAQPVHVEGQWVYTESGRKQYILLYYYAPPMAVTVTMSTKTSPVMELVNFVYDLRYQLLFLCVGGGLLGVLCMVYLCWAAGKKKGREEIRPGGLNRLPLDLYGAVVSFGLYFSTMAYVEGLLPGLYGEYYWIVAPFSVALGFVMCLLVVCWIFAFAAQVKQGGFWWRHSVVGRCLLLIFRVIRWCWRGLRAVLRLLPVTWQWLLTAAAMVIAPALALVFVSMSYGGFQAIWTLVFFGSLAMDVCLVLYGGYCFGTILKAAKEMAKGNLDHKVNTRYLLGAFKDCGENLNSLSSAAMVAAQQQMKSERMKTELIANVSHDIKTPLTSIINYVDLLQKPHCEEESQEYLAVLARQSQRLKKLTEDLVEMSKASTGNITAEPATVDACETVRQALGEFSDKLEAAELSVVFYQPEQPVMMRADGRLTWRVLNNLLGNAVKYAQPGTRLYVDVTQIDNKVLISLKNTSREQLNITADELMERFVRGDASRHTEGSGLGLNIAKGLMEAQNGTLHLHIDGDLFKVTLFFPAA